MEEANPLDTDLRTPTYEKLVDDIEPEQQLSPVRKPKTNSWQSLNFDKVLSALWIHTGTQRAADHGALRDERRRRRAFYRTVATIATGVLIGLVAYVVIKGIGALTTARYHIGSNLYQNVGPSASLSFFFLWNFALALLSCLPVIYFTQGARGSGIPECKAYLNGINMSYFLRLRCFFVTVFSTVCSVSSGIPVGPEGPLVHLGAMLSSAITFGKKRIRIFGIELVLDWKMFREFKDDADRRDWITIGCGTGFAAAFGAPIGGVLFAYEEMATYFEHRLLWRALCSTTGACFMLMWLRSGFKFSVDTRQYGVLSFGTFTDDRDMKLWEAMTIATVTGIMGGLLGAGFCFGVKSSIPFRTKYVDTPMRRVLEVGLLSILCSAVSLVLVLNVATCMSGTQDGSLEDWSLDESCNQNDYNDAAFLILNNREDALTVLLEGPEQFKPATLLATGFFFYFGMMFTYGSWISMGIFMPSIMIGGCLGGAAGVAFNLVTNQDSSVLLGAWALLGAAATLAGIQRTVISLCVIILEGTGQIRLLLPCVIATSVAKAIGDSFTHPIYEITLHAKHVPLLTPQFRGKHMLTAKDAMVSPVQWLPLRPLVSEIVRLLAIADHAAFPVLRAKELGRHVLAGGILRQQLMSIINNKIFVLCDDIGSPRHTQSKRKLRRQSLVMNAMLATSATQSKYNKAVEETGLTPEELSMRVDLEDFMNRQPTAIHEATPFQRVYRVFQAMGLRHLYVHDDDFHVVGVITRQDLFKVETANTDHAGVNQNLDQDNQQDAARSPAQRIEEVE